MSFLGRQYKYEKHEKFEEFLASLGVSSELTEAALKAHPTQTLSKDGDTYTLTTVDERGTKELVFEDGVEFDEQVTPTVQAKSTFTVDGNVVTQVQKFPDGGSMTIVREYDGDNLLVTLTTSKWDGTSLRYYTAV